MTRHGIIVLLAVAALTGCARGDTMPPGQGPAAELDSIEQTLDSIESELSSDPSG